PAVSARSHHRFDGGGGPVESLELRNLEQAFRSFGVNHARIGVLRRGVQRGLDVGQAASAGFPIHSATRSAWCSSATSIRADRTHESALEYQRSHNFR